jgi:hypothetical protein
MQPFPQLEKFSDSLGIFKKSDYLPAEEWTKLLTSNISWIVRNVRGVFMDTADLYFFVYFKNLRDVKVLRVGQTSYPKNYNIADTTFNGTRSATIDLDLQWGHDDLNTKLTNLLQDDDFAMLDVLFLKSAWNDDYYYRIPHAEKQINISINYQNIKKPVGNVPVEGEFSPEKWTNMMIKSIPAWIKHQDYAAKYETKNPNAVMVPGTQLVFCFKNMHHVRDIGENFLVRTSVNPKSDLCYTCTTISLYDPIVNNSDWNGPFNLKKTLIDRFSKLNLRNLYTGTATFDSTNNSWIINEDIDRFDFKYEPTRNTIINTGNMLWELQVEQLADKNSCDASFQIIDQYLDLLKESWKTGKDQELDQLLELKRTQMIAAFQELEDRVREQCLNPIAYKKNYLPQITRDLRRDRETSKEWKKRTKQLRKDMYLIKKNRR